MINIPHTDSNIWNAEYKTIEIISELQRTNTAIINIDNEGSDLEKLGLYRLLDNICSTFNINRSTITIQTRNQLESHCEYVIKKYPPLYIMEGQKFLKENPTVPKNLNNYFGIFIGRSSWQRLILASHLYNSYKDKLSITYHYDNKLDYHRAHMGLNELAVKISPGNAVELTSQLLNNLPIKNDVVDQYPILSPAHFAIGKIYHEFFAEVVCETFCEGTTFYPTEKTWRPIMFLTPFMIQGPVNYLANLRQLGFKTFSNYWDESYDEDGGMDGIQCIQRNIDMLSKQSIDKLNLMYNDMLPLLTHNQQVFLELTNLKFESIWN